MKIEDIEFWQQQKGYGGNVQTVTARRADKMSVRFSRSGQRGTFQKGSDKSLSLLSFDWSKQNYCEYEQKNRIRLSLRLF